MKKETCSIHLYHPHLPNVSFFIFPPFLINFEWQPLFCLCLCCVLLSNSSKGWQAGRLSPLMETPPLSTPKTRLRNSISQPRRREKVRTKTDQFAPFLPHPIPKTSRSWLAILPWYKYNCLDTFRHAKYVFFPWWNKWRWFFLLSFCRPWPFF